MCFTNGSLSKTALTKLHRWNKKCPRGRLPGPISPTPDLIRNSFTRHLSWFPQHRWKTTAVRRPCHRTVLRGEGTCPGPTQGTPPGCGGWGEKMRRCLREKTSYTWQVYEHCCGPVESEIPDLNCQTPKPSNLSFTLMNSDSDGVLLISLSLCLLVSFFSPLPSFHLSLQHIWFWIMQQLRSSLTM